jgi:hypothetical protein
VAVALALGVWTLSPRFALRSLASPAIVLATTVLVIAPWTIRNAVELDAFVPITTQTGSALAGQYNDVSETVDWSWVGPWGVPAFSSLYAGPPLGEVDLGHQLTDRATDYMVDHPGAVATVAFRNTLRLFSLRDPIWLERQSAPRVGEPAGLAQAAVYAFWMFAILAIAGAFTPAARRIPVFIWALVPLLIASVIFVGGSGRYRAPLEPIVVLLAAAAIDWALSSRARWRPS